MATVADLPYRSTPRAGGAGAPARSGAHRRPQSIPLPPARMPAWRGTRPLKRWRYVGVYDERLMICVGDAHVGPGRQTFWAIWDRERRVLKQQTALARHRAVRLAPGRVQVTAPTATIALELDERDGVETVCANGAQYAWTRKQGGIRARGSVTIDGRRIALDARAIIDDSAGYHERHTSWWWAAGVGETTAGEPAAWNLVHGINDPPAGSERSLWIAGAVSEPAPVTFAPGLEGVTGADGLDLSFDAEAVRERSENLLALRSRYRQPFGTFAGTLAPGIVLARGLGVMERHEAWW